MTNPSPEDRASRAIAEAIAKNKGENVAFYVAEQIRQAEQAKEQAAYERAAKVCDQRAINAQRRAAGHTSILSRTAARDKQEAHEDDAASIRTFAERALAQEPEKVG